MSALEASPDDPRDRSVAFTSAPCDGVALPILGDGPAGLRVKACLDRGGAALLLVALMPVLLMIVLLVRLTSRGPAIFRQVRVGRDGVPFVMYKFRTMCIDAEDLLQDLVDTEQGPALLFKMQHDPRVTGVGRLLRRSSLDELPQLVNVILGHMSLIGPRPALPHEAEHYDEWSRRRLDVRPGMTGLWQVSGRSHLSWEESIRIDLEYVDHWSMRRDMVIVLRTLRAVVTARGAM